MSDTNTFIFGSGSACRHWLSENNTPVRIVGIIDNDASKIGMHLFGIKIYPPSILSDFNPSTTHVIICSAYYEDILLQIEKVVYDTINVLPLFQINFLKTSCSVDDLLDSLIYLAFLMLLLRITVILAAICWEILIY